MKHEICKLILKQASLCWCQNQCEEIHDFAHLTGFHDRYRFCVSDYSRRHDSTPRKVGHAAHT